MFAYNFDYILSKLFTKKWKLDTIIVPHQFQVPRIHQLNLNEDNMALLFKYPSHYQHHAALQYNSAFLGYFSILGSIVLYSAIRMRKRSKFGCIVLGSISLLSYYEGAILYNRVHDVKSVVVKEDGKHLLVRTFQDELPHEIDISDLRLTNKDKTDLIIFTDRKFSQNGKFKFFFLEPSNATVIDKLLFNIIFIDNRYLIY